MKKFVPFLTLLFIGCQESEPAPKPTVQKEPVAVDTMSNEEMTSYINEFQPDTSDLPSDEFIYPEIPTTDIEVQVEDVATYVLGLMSQKKVAELASFTHPDHTLWISPSTYLSESTFSTDGRLLGKLYESEEVIRWYDITISGEPLELTFKDYFEQYIWDRNYLEADQYINEFIKRGPIVNNIKSNFPDCEIVECIVEGDEELDWSSLNLIFKNVEGKYYLLGIVHDQYII